MIDAIRRSGADALFVAMPTPAKERLLARWGDALGVSFAMGVGGAFDFIAGVRKRAPQWMQKLGIEWLYRVIQEPRRIKRIYNATVKFPLTVLRKTKKII